MVFVLFFKKICYLIKCNEYSIEQNNPAVWLRKQKKVTLDNIKS